MRYNVLLLVCLLLFSCSPVGKREEPAIDKRSYNLGIIGAFGEIVNAGVKKLALSEALPPAEMDVLMQDAQRVAQRNHVLLYRESSLIITGLFPDDVAKGKEVLLIYQGTVKDEYLSLKAEADSLQRAGAYSGNARAGISRRFGKMLSYPDRYINELMAANGLDTTHSP